MSDQESPRVPPPSVSVAQLLEDPLLGVPLRVLAGRGGLQRLITHPRVQKSGLAMVGHLQGVSPTRLQVLGETELSYAESLSPEAQQRAARHLFSLGLSCVVITRGATPPPAFLEEADRTATPVVGAPARSSATITALHAVLDERLAPRARLHGVLVDVYGVGVLLSGKSGIGKSEAALELVMRGHRLVADDVVEADYRPPGAVYGQAAELLRHHLEVRGLGVLNVMDLYGVTAVRARIRIELVVALELWRAEAEYERLGLDVEACSILGVPVRRVTLPVRPGRNMSRIIEIAARSELLRQAGRNPVEDFVRRVEAASLGEAPSREELG